MNKMRFYSYPNPRRQIHRHQISLCKSEMPAPRMWSVWLNSTYLFKSQTTCGSWTQGCAEPFTCKQRPRRIRRGPLYAAIFGTATPPWENWETWHESQSYVRMKQLFFSQGYPMTIQIWSDISVSFWGMKKKKKHVSWCNQAKVSHFFHRFLCRFLIHRLIQRHNSILKSTRRLLRRGRCCGKLQKWTKECVGFGSAMTTLSKVILVHANLRVYVHFSNQVTCFGFSRRAVPKISNWVGKKCDARAAWKHTFDRKSTRSQMFWSVHAGVHPRSHLHGSYLSCK